MRSIWKGAISFGLVSIPVKLYSATEEKDVAFHQVHRTDGGRIRYRRVCQNDGEEIQYSDIAKGYELSNGEVVVLTDDDFTDLPLSTSRSIDVLEFVPLEQVDPMYFTRSYYLEPERAGTKPYLLLREALQRSGRVALVKVALRQRESLATLRVRDGVFVLETMLWPDEIREPDFGFLDEEVDLRPQEVAMAGSLIDSLSGDFHPEDYSDQYRQALEALIEAKVAGREVLQPPEVTDRPGPVVDLMAALRASVEAAQRERGIPATPVAAKAASGGSAGRRGTAGRAAGSRSGSGASRSRSSGSPGTGAGSGGTRSGSTGGRSGATASGRGRSGAARSGQAGQGGNGRRAAADGERRSRRPARRSA